MIVLAWAVAFALTFAIEAGVVAVLGPRMPRRYRVVLVAQLVTHPLVWIAMATLPGPQAVRLAGVELGATLVEAVLYTRFFGLSRSEAFGLSAVANAASVLLVAAAGMLAHAAL